MRPSAALDLGEVRLADRCSRFAAARFGFVGLLDGPDQFLLGHGAAQAAEITFDLAKIADFVAKFHIADRDNDITICNKSKRTPKIIIPRSKR
jgi:hypothetical protein